MRIAVVGDQGLLGREFKAICDRAGIVYWGFNRSNLDLSKDVLSLVPHFLNVDVIVNCVAFTDVDASELNNDLAFLINSTYAGKLASVAALTGCRIIQISTDYVFSGESPDPYSVDSAPSPISVYGKSKLAGELAIERSGAKYTIARTAWLYGTYGRCFPKTIQTMLGQRSKIKVVQDQFGQPTWTQDVAKQIVEIAQFGSEQDIVHITSQGRTSWADFATLVATGLGYEGENVIERVSSFEFKSLARRPANSTLESSSPLGDWKERWLVAAESVLLQTPGGKSNSESM